MIKNGFLLIFLTLFSIVPAPVTAGESPSAEALVDHNTITIGDPVIYTLMVRHQPGAKLNAPLQIPRSPDFEVSRVEDFRRSEDGLTIQGKKVTLTSYRLGEFVLDPVTVNLIDEKNKSLSLQTPAIYIQVVSAQKGAPSKDIRGIKSVVDIPIRFFKKYGLPLGGVAIFFISAFLIWRRFRKGKPTAIVLQDILSPEDEAFRSLHDLFDSTLLRQGKSKDYFFRLSEILRTYFEKRYLIFAVEATTVEIIKLLREKEVPSAIIADAQDVLEMSDLAKFAKWKPEPSEILRINQKAEDVIKKAAAQSKVPSYGI